MIRSGFIFFLLITITQSGFAQHDTIPSISEVPLKFIEGSNKKIEKYTNRLSSKTEKALEKLTKWENKIQTLLRKADPASAERLFGPGKITFAAMLQKVKAGVALKDNYKSKYDSYRDKLTTNLKYIESQKENLAGKYIKPLQKANKDIIKLEENITESESAQALIKERKKELINEAVKHLGKSKYLRKINKEAYYYTETLRNYKEIFNDPVKAEAAALKVLNHIPAFKEFMKRNSGLASLFGTSQSGTAANLTGLQTRTDVSALIQTNIASGGPNASSVVSQNMQAAKAQIQELQNKIFKAGTGNSDAEVPDFKPNLQKTKTLFQRLEFGSNFQFARPNRFSKSVADIGLSAGYKLNNKSIAGIGIAYKMGYGSIQKLNISHEGLGLRSFIDWKLKSQFFVTGGYEMNYLSVFTNLRTLQQTNAWQSSGLIGISKKIKFKTKFVKGTKFQLLFDLLHKKHVVSTQPVLIRMGYDF